MKIFVLCCGKNQRIKAIKVIVKFVCILPKLFWAKKLQQGVYVSFFFQNISIEHFQASIKAQSSNFSPGTRNISHSSSSLSRP